jgi:hypothetical protein
LQTSASASTILSPVADKTSSSSSEDKDDLQRPASPIVPNNIVPAVAMHNETESNRRRHFFPNIVLYENVKKIQE